MVYRGKPSAGCEHCRRAKKRCTLEVPACARCIKLNIPCSGYRDTTSLQIQDETQQVSRRAQKRQAQFSSAKPTSPQNSSRNVLSTKHAIEPDWSFGADLESFEMCVVANQTPTAGYPYSNFTQHKTSPSSTEFPSEAFYASTPYNPERDSILTPSSSYFIDAKLSTQSLTYNPQPAPDEIAVNFFLSYFVSQNHWNYMTRYAALPLLDPCLTLAIRACGMAALDNVQPVPRGRDWSRRKYVEALQLLNTALRDVRRARTDESLMAVTLLGLYENLTCDGPQSIHSWKAHMTGAAQLLRVRGVAQFETLVGQNLFRETRSQIMTHCMWDNLEPPSFLDEWTPALQSRTQNLPFILPADEMMQIAFDYATLESRIRNHTLSNSAALAATNAIYTRLLTWALETPLSNPYWSYTTECVPDAPHIWNGILHSYHGLPTPSVWNFYRGVRIMVSRTQETLSRRLSPSTLSQQTHFRTVRRSLTDDICSSIPCLLGLAPPTVFSSHNVLVTAYSAIWPLFLAGTCVLERCSHSVFDPPELQTRDLGSAAQAQLNWICARLDYVSEVVGLRWAKGVGRTLKGDFSVLVDMRVEFEDEEAGESGLAVAM